ncbi:type II secretion system GspH family protein [Clostridium sardiniense]|uniref:Type II secretion system GspH family protein n=1 Tax=Clostridium sardiniense TaxID=29369 RepID=A0ABS7KUB9_CLOSR|nr:type II secretion system protein [Clostridium sardiniense]MBY0754406.1 type II secretion system GspH family protein [Clostridium sardiniense]MDQ0461281.1 type IV pilus assembly protein PilA [Clostridium sardiniense]
MKKKGFTLIELIAVIAILAILAVIAVPRVISYVDRSKKVAIQTEAKVIYDAAERAYNEGILIPTSNNIWDYNNGSTQKQTPKFEYMIVFEKDYCKNGSEPVLDVLQKHDLISKVNAEKDNRMLGAAYYIGSLKQVIDANPNDIVLNKDGTLNNWYGNPIK